MINKFMFSFWKKKEPQIRTAPCPQCGTLDCTPKAPIGVQGAGQLYVVGGSNALAKTCKFRRQIRLLKQMKTTQQGE